MLSSNLLKVKDASGQWQAIPVIRSADTGGGGGGVTDVIVKGISVVDEFGVATVPAITQLSDLLQDSEHRSVTDAEKATWTAKQNAISDLDAIRTGASKGNTAVQPSALSVYERSQNKVTSLSGSSTDTQYPSAKCVYNTIGDIAAALSNL